MGGTNSPSTRLEGEVMGILYVGIDLAKNVFAVNGVDEHGKAVKAPMLSVVILR